MMMTPQEKHQLKRRVYDALAKAIGRKDMLFKRAEREIMKVIDEEGAPQ